MKKLAPVSPAQSFAEAVERIKALQTLDEAQQVDPRSMLIFLSHGARTTRAILLLHGYTNSPRQFIKLADEFFQRGYNVLIPRFPYHGLKDRMTSALENQTAQELLSFTNEAVDILCGLGDQVTVMGISMGGVLALWIATQRSDVSQVCAISPALAFHAIPLSLTSIMMRAFLLLPNQFRWWSEELKDTPLPPLHTYPRFSTRGLAHILDIGLKVRNLSYHIKPQVGSVFVVINPSDQSVNNSYAYEIVKHWSALGAPQVKLYEFEKNYQLIHDLIDPDQPKQQIGVVYPILLDLITG